MLIFVAHFWINQSFTYQKTLTMNKKAFALLLLLGMVITSVNLVAQKLWSLEECVAYAYENNIQIKQSYLGVESSNLSLDQSKINLAPSFNASLSQNYRWGRTPPPQTNVYTKSSFVTLHHFFVIHNKYDSQYNSR